MKYCKTTYRVIYGDTDNMGIAYHANFFRWFEMGRSEMFRAIGLTYKMIEAKGFFLPVSEAYCKYLSPAGYDDVILIKTMLDAGFKGGMKFDYQISNEDEDRIHAKGFTKHACIDSHGRVIRPPDFLVEIINKTDE